MYSWGIYDERGKRCVSVPQLLHVCQAMGSKVMLSPSEYFENCLGKVLVDTLVCCASIKPKNPIEYLSFQIEQRSFSNERKQHRTEAATKPQPHGASLYFRNTFGSSLKQALFEAILMKPENPIAALAGGLERTYVDGTALQSRSSKLTRYYRQTAPIITDLRSLTSKGFLKVCIVSFSYFSILGLRMAGRKASVKNEEDGRKIDLTDHIVLVKPSENSNFFIALKEFI